MDVDFVLRQQTVPHSTAISPPGEKGGVYLLSGSSHESHIPSGNGSMKHAREMNPLSRIVNEVRNQQPEKQPDPKSSYSNLPLGGPFKYTDGSTYQGKFESSLLTLRPVPKFQENGIRHLHLPRRDRLRRILTRRSVRRRGKVYKWRRRYA